MVRFFSRPAIPHPDDLCLVHTPLPGPPAFRPSAEGWWAPRSTLSMGVEPGLFLGEVAGRPLWALETVAPPPEVWTGLRSLMADGPADQVKAAIRAAELAAWQRDHRYCGACGAPTRRRDHQVAFECPVCGSEFWPRVTPAVIMLVHRGDEVLLARNSRSTAGFHSTLAGFVEAGETLEEAVAREVAEEVGVEVGTPVYLASQPWPFPHALMVGFHVPWVSGEPVPDGIEIAEAGWFRRDRLPLLPPPLSIARQLIRTYFGDPTV